MFWMGKELNKHIFSSKYSILQMSLFYQEKFFLVISELFHCLCKSLRIG